ncbi:protein scabrous [Phymastichus coffea]|uniref:protein scabrous n=1 Tax=Phymastichus coffea TaxID=108790 RepID=UPI00273BD7EB|nr:protein scabrous [Phymastichus coffea]
MQPRLAAPLLLLLLLLLCLCLAVRAQDDDLASSVKFLQEQLGDLLNHRQQDYDALELSLKQSMEKNTELLLLRNEVKQMRKELNSLRNSDTSTTAAVNERLRVRWLGNAVTELKNEVSEVLRSRNASEELAERARVKSELELLRADVAGVGRGLRDFGGRLARLEAGLGSVRLDVAAVKRSTGQLSRSCADFASQLSGVQRKLADAGDAEDAEQNEIEPPPPPPPPSRHRRRHAHSRLAPALRRLDARVGRLERERGPAEQRLARRLRLLEGAGRELRQRLRAASAEPAELAELRRAVRALGASASALQQRSERQREALDRLNGTLRRQAGLDAGLGRAENLTRQLERVEDEYRRMVDSLPGNCEKRDGLTLLAPGPGAPLLAACRKGWIVVGRRVDGTVDFDRSWNDYAAGFGSPINEFWAGNEALHRLSSDNCTRLRIELHDIDGNYWVANYEDFRVDDEQSGYRLRVGGYSGNASDAMAYQNNMRFSAKDRDLDISSTDCAANYHGGWWFSHCQHANLNGRYSLGLTWYRSDSSKWMAVANTEISLQRKQQCL